VTVPSASAEVPPSTVRPSPSVAVVKAAVGGWFTGATVPTGVTRKEVNRTAVAAVAAFGR
jgi:hypothetical protein